MDINRYKPSYGVAHTHMTNISDYSTEELFELLYASKVMKAKFIAKEDCRILKGVTMAFLFCDTSLRTRSALEIGIRQLGGASIDLPYNESDMRAGENIQDIVNAISRYGVGALITRGISQKELDSFCAVSELPVINTFNECGAPLQTICDLFTVWERAKKLEGVKLAYVGKCTSNAISLITGAVKCGLEVSVSCPEEFAFPQEALDNARQYGKVNVSLNPAEGVTGADFVYTDNYEYHNNLTEKEKEILLPYQVNKTLLSYCSPEVKFMHALPARRGVEVTAEIIDGKSSITLMQAENKLHTVKAVLALLSK